MNKFLLIPLLALLFGCSSRGIDIASLPMDSLVATTGPIPIAMEHKLTREDRDRLYRFYPKTLERIDNYERLSMQDVINMTRSGVSDDTIIYEISLTRSRFYLTPQDERTLEQAGVSRRVIHEMMDTSNDRY